MLKPPLCLQPIVKVTYAPARKYWFVSILCVDRDKLLFDLVCTFVDLDFDVFHATLDAEETGDVVKTTIEFYVRPRLGGPEYDEAKGRLLGEMLRASILRRLPQGLQLNVRTYQVRFRLVWRTVAKHAMRAARTSSPASWRGQR